MTTSTFVALVAAGVVFAGVLVACRSSAEAGEAPPPEDASDGSGAPTPLAFERVASGPQSAIRTEGLRPAYDTAGLDALWAEHGKLQLPAPPAPAVELGGRAAFGVFLGNRPTGGYAVEVVRVLRRADGTLVVEAVERTPAPGSMNTQAVTAPFELVAVEGAAPGEPFELVLTPETR
ncbi:MAG: protease complex subunit PrcB family protein [Planctomycetota bacterium]